MSPKPEAALASDAPAICAIYAPIVLETVISFELEAPTVEIMRERILATTKCLPWLVRRDEDGAVVAYAYASRHRERAAYQWAVDVSAYVHPEHRHKGLARSLYAALFLELKKLGYCQAFAGIALPNAASVGLHESMGFTPIGVYRHVGFKLGSWHDVGWWQKELQRLADPAPPAAFWDRTLKHEGDP